MRKAAAWGVVLLAGVGGWYLSTWLAIPLVRLTAAHTSLGAAVAITILRLILWLAILLAGLVVANRMLK